MKRTLGTLIALFISLAACQPTPAATPRPIVLPGPPTATATEPAATATLPPPSATAIPLSDGEFLAPPLEGVIRVMSYNVNWDSIFPDGDRENHSFRSANRSAQFARLLAAIRPDVVCLQEINPARTGEQVAGVLSAALGGEGWQATGERDNFIATRFGLLTEGYEIDILAYPPELPQAAALVDLPDERFGATDLYLVCAHFKSAGQRSDIALRQRQADVIIDHLRDALTPGGEFDLGANTPFLLLGDFNVYDTDPAYHLTTLLTGDIIDEGRYGTDFAPDWDGSALTDALPSINGLGLEFYTWREDGSPFAPGALDRILYSDSVLVVHNAFVLDTTRLTPEALALYDLQADDVLLNGDPGNYDHLPLVIDIEIP